MLYGERGVGKSSIARIEAQFAPDETFYYSVSADDTFETIAVAMLQAYNVGWTPRSRSHDSTRAAQGSLEIGGVRAGASGLRSTGEQEGQIDEPRLTAQQIASRLPERASLVIVDDFERLVSARDRAAFADLIKKLSDNENAATLMLVGIADNIDELLTAHESAQRSIVEVKVERLPDSDIGEIIDVGMRALGLEILPETANQIVEFSARFPYYTHLLCEGAVRNLINRVSTDPTQTPVVGPNDLAYSIGQAIRNAQRPIIRAYEGAVRSIRESPRFKYCLYAIASWPTEPVAYGDICRWVGKMVNAPSGEVNVSHQLKRLEDLTVIERPSTGFYRLRNPMLKAYVILKARADTPENELQAIDAHIDEIRKRMDRVKERL